jgi:hypothetical protein
MVFLRELARTPRPENGYAVFPSALSRTLSSILPSAAGSRALVGEFDGFV